MSAPLQARIAAALARLALLARSRERGAARAAEVSPLQAAVLATLLRRGELRLGALAAELRVTDGTASAAASTLEAKGLVRKAADPAEHRAVLLGLTRKGALVARRTGAWGEELFAPVVAELGPEEAAALLGALLKLVRAFERRGAIQAARMCLSCRFFEPGGGRGDRPHFCRLLEQPIGGHELQVDCPDHETADAERLEALWRAFVAS